jgi:hypothetical protein
MTELELIKKIQSILFESENELTDLEEKEIIGLIRQAKSEWCKEQRENCAKTVIYNSVPFYDEDTILNAPEPG